MKDIFVVVPAYNESKHIKKVINELKKFEYNIVVVNDGSKDDTLEILKQIKDITILPHIINLGKGGALKTGCDYAVQNGAKIIVVMDSDGQHNPKDIPRFLDKLKKCELVFGSRGIDKNMPSILRFGNNVINLTTKILYGVDLIDTQSGFRAFRNTAYKKIRWDSNDYSMESEMIANVSKNNISYDEITIKTVYNDKHKGTTVIDGIKIVLKILSWRLKR